MVARMKNVQSAGSVECFDSSGKPHSTRWSVWEDDMGRRLEMTYKGHTEGITITSTQLSRDTQQTLAEHVFSRMLQDLGY